MSEHPADKALGANWRDPRQVRKENAWANLDPATRAQFTELQRNGWRDDVRFERFEHEPEQDAWVEYELVPPDPPDPRWSEPAKRIGRWSVKEERDAQSRANAIVSEHEVLE
jgi:hypothetical protein